MLELSNDGRLSALLRFTSTTLPEHKMLWNLSAEFCARASAL